MRRAVATSLCAAVAALAAAGCGNDRTEPPGLGGGTPAAPRGAKVVDLPMDGLRITVPANWERDRRDPPKLVVSSSAGAVIAVWRYPRAEPLPAGTPALEEARGRLEQRVRERDPTFQTRSSRVLELAGAPGIELLGSQTVGGRRVDVRSVHLFTEGGELVVDLLAPPRDFARLDPTTFAAVLASIRLSSPGA